MDEDHAQEPPKSQDGAGIGGEKEEGLRTALHTQPDHLAILGGELLSVKAQLDRIETMLKDRSDQ